MPGDLMSDDDVRDVVVRAPMTFDEARRLTDRANTTLADFQGQIIELWHGRAHEALGYKAWPDYVKAEFKMLPRMGRLQRRDTVRELSAEGMSLREIAASLGVDKDTVGRDLSPLGTPEPPAGADQPDPTTAPAGTSEPPAAAIKGPAAAGPEDLHNGVHPQPGDPAPATPDGVEGFVRGAEQLNKDYERRFPGVTAHENGLTFDKRVLPWMKGWKP